MKKILSLILVAIMLVSCLAGCGGTATSGDESDPMAERGLGAAATDLPDGIMLTQVVADLIPQIVADADKYLDGEYTTDEAIEVFNAYRGDYDYSMAQTHDVETKKHLDRIVKMLKEIKELEEAEAAGEVEETTEEPVEGEEVVEEEEEPTPIEEILERRNKIAAILNLDQRDAI